MAYNLACKVVMFATPRCLLLLYYYCGTKDKLHWGQDYVTI